MKGVNLVEIIMLLSLIILSIATVEGKKLRRSVIYLGAFSLLSSFVFLIYNAPDVAIAEAVIGCTISVVLFLTALKKYRIITIYYAYHHEEQLNKEISQVYCSKLIYDLELYLIDNEFEPQLIKTSLDDETLHENEDFDLLVVNTGDFISIYSAKDNYHTPFIGEYIDRYLHENKNMKLPVEFIPLKEDSDYEG